jgi:hypothetical protein
MTIKERLCFIRKAFSTTKNEMLISLCIIIVLTCILSLIFLTVERIAQPDVFADYGDAIVWAYTRYMEGGDAVFEGGPVTVVGKVIASLLGIIGIAIVAIPAGLVGSGFMDAIAEEKREKELAELRHRMLKQFPRFVSPAFNSYRKTLEASTEWENARFTTRAQLMSCFQTRLGMDFKDIADVCTRYPEFSLRDIAEELSDEENQQSTFWIELLPKNRPYGCFINRGSRVTIMVTNGFEDMGTSWLGYHVALLGGFNFICKNQEVDPDDLDSYYALTPEVTYEKRTEAYYLSDKKQYKHQLDIIRKKQAAREAFFGDLQPLLGEEHWVINLQTTIKSSHNPVDIHFVYDNRDRNHPSVNQVSDVEQMIATFQTAFQQAPFDNGTPMQVQQSDKFSLSKNNIAYKLREQNQKTNMLHIRIASSLINIDLRRSVVMGVIAHILHEQLASNETLRKEDMQELSSQGYGYPFEA